MCVCVCVCVCVRVCVCVSLQVKMCISLNHIRDHIMGVWIVLLNVAYLNRDLNISLVSHNIVQSHPLLRLYNTNDWLWTLEYD